MNRIVTSIILSFIFQYSFAQSCETYSIKCIGKINSKSLIIQKIKLPEMFFLLGKEGLSSRNKFIEVKPIENTIDIMLGFDYGSRSIKPEKLLEFLKTKTEYFPIVISTIKNGNNKDIELQLAWDKIKITKVENSSIGLFELDLNTINIK